MKQCTCQLSYDFWFIFLSTFDSNCIDFCLKPHHFHWTHNLCTKSAGLLLIYLPGLFRIRKSLGFSAKSASIRHNAPYAHLDGFFSVFISLLSIGTEASLTLWLGIADTTHFICGTTFHSDSVESKMIAGTKRWNEAIDDDNRNDKTYIWPSSLLRRITYEGIEKCMREWKETNIYHQSSSVISINQRG